MKNILCLLVVVMLSACSNTSRLPKNYTLNETNNIGLLVASISYSGNYSEYSVFIRNLTTLSMYQLSYGESLKLLPIVPKGDFSDIGRQGGLYTEELPAGEYEVYSWAIYSGVATVKPQNQFSYKFKVAPGKITYLGNFYFIQTQSMGLTVTGAEVKYTNKKEVDFNVLAKKYPKIDRSKLAFSIHEDTVINKLGNESSYDIDWTINYIHYQ